MRLHFLGKAKKLLKLLLVKETTNSQVKLSTIQQAFFKATTVTKDFSKICHATVDVHSWKYEYQTTCFQSHNSHRRVRKMPLEVAVVSISQNSILLAFTKPGQSPKTSQNATQTSQNATWWQMTLLPGIASITAIDLIQRQKFIS